MVGGNKYILEVNLISSKYLVKTVITIKMHGFTMN